MKPSDEFVIDEVIGQSVDVPKLANAFDKLHDRVVEQDLLIAQLQDTIRHHFGKNPDPKQEPKECEDSNCYCKPEKQESLADYLDAVYDRTMTIAEARSSIKTWFVRLVNEITYLNIDGASGKRTLVVSFDELKKKVMEA